MEEWEAALEQMRQRELREWQLENLRIARKLWKMQYEDEPYDVVTNAIRVSDGMGFWSE